MLDIADDHVVVFTKSTTEGINRLARLFGARQAIVFTSIMEHHANLLPWSLNGCEMRYVQADAFGVNDEQTGDYIPLPGIDLPVLPFMTTDVTGG